MASISSTSASHFDELRWLINIRRSLAEELEEEEEIEVPVSIFNVPKALMLTDPESYVPQLVALGPYHYWRPELHEMETYKLAAAKRTQKHLQCLQFHTLVENLMRFEPRIRACYHKYLHFDGETLAWMMAIDASFLLEFLQIYGIRQGKKTLSRMSAHNSILRDVVMLENQIQLFILRKVLEIQNSSLESADELLVSMLNGLSKELSPLRTMDHSVKIDVSTCAHVLNFLHDTIVPKLDEEQCETSEPEDNKTSDSQVPKQLLSESWNLVSRMKRNSFRIIKALLHSRPARVLLKLPLKIVSNLPGILILKQLIKHVFFPQDNEEREAKPDHGSGRNKPPPAEEIAIPSVEDLLKSGVRFIPTNGNISKITFDPNTVTFHLPTVTLDINTKVVLRNLVAYEASKASGPLVFTRYTELMNGIIDTEQDVKLLSEKGIILNHLKSDEEAAELWNGMSKSIRLTKVAFLDKVIEDVNKYHNYRWNVKARKFFKQYVYGSWQLLTLLAAIMILILLTFQTFCSVYSCSRVLRIQA
ncbi:putative UPF0481 protein [Hibiscus syriacus]|uniref:UPF0481 protein n=2 Tax=Hibiscus syriacus TaxID=106335 RepID=A0A6A3D1M6_HIBSY|nr:putative UPF0481 protein [Hibiscus syriacus]